MSYTKNTTHSNGKISPSYKNLLLDTTGRDRTSNPIDITASTTNYLKTFEENDGLTVLNSDPILRNDDIFRVSDNYHHLGNINHNTFLDFHVYSDNFSDDEFLDPGQLFNKRSNMLNIKRDQMPRDIHNSAYLHRFYNESVSPAEFFGDNPAEFLDNSPAKFINDSPAKFLNKIPLNTTGLKYDDPNECRDNKQSKEHIVNTEKFEASATKGRKKKKDNAFNDVTTNAIKLLKKHGNLILQIVKHASIIDKNKKDQKTNGKDQKTNGKDKKQKGKPNIDKGHYCVVALLNYIFNATADTAGNKNMSINHLDFCASLYHILKAVKINKDVLNFCHKCDSSYVTQKCEELMSEVIQLGKYYTVTEVSIYDLLDSIGIPTRSLYKNDKFCFRTKFTYGKSLIRDKRKVNINKLAKDITKLYERWGVYIKEMMNESFYIGTCPLGDVLETLCIRPVDSHNSDSDYDSDSDYNPDVISASDSDETFCNHTSQPNNNKKQKSEIWAYDDPNDDLQLSKLRVITKTDQVTVHRDITENPVLYTARKLLSYEGLVLQILKYVSTFDEDKICAQNKKSNISCRYYCVFALLNYIFNATLHKAKSINITYIVFIESLYKILRIIKNNEKLLNFDPTDKNDIHLKCLEFLEKLEEMDKYDSVNKTTIYNFLNLLEIPTAQQYKKEKSCFIKTSHVNSDKKFDFDKLVKDVTIMYTEWSDKIKEMMKDLFYIGESPFKDVIETPCFISSSAITGEKP